MALEKVKSLKLISLNKALNLIRESLKGYRPKVESVPIAESLNRISARDLRAKKNVPSYPIAALDGIAVRSSDLTYATPTNPIRLSLAKQEPLREGEALPISTGMKIPKGADAVVRYEHFRAKKDFFEITSPIDFGKNVVKIGEEVKVKDLILKRGKRIKPEDVALLMELGIKKLEVYAKPNLAIIPVGDELYEGFKERGMEAINYSYIILKKAESLGAKISLWEVSPDDEKFLKERIREACEKSDLVFTLAGCSIGENDIVPRVLHSLKGEIFFHGLNYNPSKPAGYSMVMGKPLLMLPGHVVSMVSSFYLLAKPLLKILMGWKEEDRVFFALCKSSLKVKKGMGNLILVKLEREKENYFAIPMGWGTNAIKNLVNADGFVMLDKDEAFEEGKRVEVHPL